MEFPISKKIVEKIYGKEIDVAFTNFYFNPAVEYGYVIKEGLGYKIVLGRLFNKNTIAHEIAHIKLGHLEQKDKLYHLGLTAFHINLIQDIEVELYIRKEGFNSAPQFSDDDLIKFYDKIVEWL